MKRSTRTRFARRPDAGHRRNRSGQALLESFGIIILLCLILFGVVQYVLMLTATEVMQYSADAAARARAVGLNPFMVEKVALVAGIPNAGAMEVPSQQTYGNANAWSTRSPGSSFYASIRQNPSSSQYWQIERYHIPLFLGAENHSRMYGILKYEDWEDIQRPSYVGIPGQTAGVVMRQEYSLRMPFVGAYSDNDHIDLRREARLADHAELYLR